MNTNISPIELALQKKLDKLQPKTKTPTKSRKSRKRKNWIAIAIVALIVAIIPISLKYLSPGLTQQLLSEKAADKIRHGSAWQHH